jgi:hypothetical protein
MQVAEDLLLLQLVELVDHLAEDLLLEDLLVVLLEDY